MQTEVLRILHEINRLNELHPPLVSHACYNKDCEICPKLQQLGRKYESIIAANKKKRKRLGEKEIEIKTAEIIAKRDYATKTEIEFLIYTAKMTKAEVAKAMRVGHQRILDACKGWEIGRVKRRQGA